ncbi:MAG: clostripain-related cysteine peptidase [Bdellovibrionia bacterium]
MKIWILALMAGWLLGPVSVQAAVKDWTLLVFINGHNNLDSYGDADINEMEMVGSTDAINVVVQRATLKQNTMRLFVTKDANVKKITSPVVQDLGKKVDMGNYQNLTEFVKWGATAYPAKRYFVVVWNHGSGWHRSHQLTRGISYDDVYNSHITTPQLGLAMKDIGAAIGHKVDVLGMDACLMAMPDIASEFSDYVETYVASEETEPLEGWPYDALLTKWAQNPTWKPNEVAAHLTDAYIKSYSGGSQGTDEATTLSAFDLTMLDKLERAILDLGKSIRAMSATEKAKVLKAISQSVGFYYNDYKDLGDFMMNMRKAGVRGDITIEVEALLTKFVVSNAVSPKFPKAKGAAFWLPSSSSTFKFYKAQYAALQFHKRTEWGLALEALFP